MHLLKRESHETGWKTYGHYKAQIGASVHDTWEYKRMKQVVSMEQEQEQEEEEVAARAYELEDRQQTLSWEEFKFLFYLL